MSHRKILVGLSLSAVMGLSVAYAQNKPAAPAAGGAGGAPAAAAKPTCKLHGKTCCDPAVEAHLPKEAVFKACGESEATYLGEEAQATPASTSSRSRGRRKTRRSCRFTRPSEGGAARAERSVLLVEEGRQGVRHGQGEVAQGGADGGVNSTGLYLPGKGYFGQRQRVDEGLHRAEATKLAP